VRTSGCGYPGNNLEKNSKGDYKSHPKAHHPRNNQKSICDMFLANMMSVLPPCVFMGKRTSHPHKRKEKELAANNPVVPQISLVLPTPPPPPPKCCQEYFLLIPK